VEKKDVEVGLNSRLLKKDNKRFMRSPYVLLGAGKSKAMPPRFLRPFTAQHCQGPHAHTAKNVISIFIDF
jgi:hypothetical protein